MHARMHAHKHIQFIQACMHTTPNVHTHIRTCIRNIIRGIMAFVDSETISA